MEAKPIVERKHGWLLSVLMIGFLIFRGLNLLYAIVLISDDGPQAETLLTVIIESLMIMFIVAAGDWKKWGCFGAIILSIFIGGMNFLLAVIEFQIIGLLLGLVVVSIVPLIMYLFYRSKRQFFE